MAHVVVGVEADQVGAQHAASTAPRARAACGTSRSQGRGCAKRSPPAPRAPPPARAKAEASGGSPGPTPRRPGARPRPRHRRTARSRGRWSLPRLLVEVRVLGKAVEKRPQRGVREALVIQRRVVALPDVSACRRARPAPRPCAPPRPRRAPRRSSADPIQRFPDRSCNGPKAVASPPALRVMGVLARLVDVHAVGQPVRDDDLAAGRRAARQGLSLRGRARAASGCRTFGRGPFACRRSAHGSTFARFARPPL